MKTKLTDFKAKLLKHCILIAIFFITINHINYAQSCKDCNVNLATEFNSDDWEAWYNNAFITENLNEVHNGESAVKIPLNLEDGFYYRHWFKHNKSDTRKRSLNVNAKYAGYGWAGFGVHYLDEDGNYSQQALDISGNTWKQYELELDIPEGTKWYRIWVFKTSDGVAFFDNVCFSKVSLMSTNGDFERGNLHNWQNWGNTIISADEYEGTYAARVKNNEGGAVFLNWDPIDPYKNYVLKAYGKKAGAVHWAGIGVHYFDENDNHIKTDAAEITNNRYNQYTLEFIPPSNAKYAFPWFWQSGGGDLYVDNFCLNEAPYCSNKKGSTWSSFNFMEHHFMNCLEYNADGTCKKHAAKSNVATGLNRKSPSLLKKLDLSWYSNARRVPQDLLNSAGDMNPSNRFTEIEHTASVYAPYENVTVDIIKNEVEADYLIGYNEIDLNNISAEQAIKHWKIMSVFPRQLVSLCTFNNPVTNDDFIEYMDAVEARNDLRVDIIQAHYYPIKSPDPANGGFAEGDIEAIRTDVKKFLKDIHDKWNKPIWITEFGLMPPGKHDDDWCLTEPPLHHSIEQQLEFMEAVISVFETTDYVFRYAWYGPYADKGYREAKSDDKCDKDNDGFKDFTNHWQQWKTNLFEKHQTENKLTKLGIQYRDISRNAGCSGMYRLASPVDKDLISNIGIPTDLVTKTLFNIQVSPNPNVGNAELSFQTKEAGDVQIKLIDINGRVIFKSKVSAVDGINQVPLNLSNFQSGMYLIQINNGKEFLSSKVQLVEP